MAKLGDVADFLDHLRRPIKEGERKVGSVPYYGANGLQGWIDGHLFDEPLVLLAEDGGHFGVPDRTIAYWIEGKSWVNNHAHVLRPRDNVDGPYLRRLLEQYDVTPFITGSTRGKLTKGAAFQIEIPLPPLDEQKRIAAVLDKADALRCQRLESLQLTERLLQSVFIDMFGDPATNPKGLPMLELGGFGIVQTGNTPPRSNLANYAETGLEWIKTDNIVEDKVVVTPSLERLSEVGAKVARVAPAGSLLVACIAGSKKSIGRAAMTDRMVAFNQQINSITPHAGTSQLFLYYLVKIARRQIQLAAGKGMKKMIKKSTFEGLRFIAPEYDEQLRFERVAERLIEQSKDCQKQLFELERFFSSIQQRAFRGELDLRRLKLDEEAEADRKAHV